jgi:hypothetical protein
MEKRIRMNISVTKKENLLLKKIAQEEKRPYSRQIVYMMEFYIKNNNQSRNTEKNHEIHL